VLVVAPDAFLEREGPRQGWDYLSVDLEPGLAMRRMDLTALDLPDEDRDLVIAYHVLEHIADDRAAMREIARVLRPGGTALIEVPLAGDETDERFIDGPVEQRVRHYGQGDHVRMYGRRDFVGRLEESGLAARTVRVGDALPAHVTTAALMPDEVFFVVRRAKSG
jgi:SAM-dependent methyltransferase